MSQYNNIKRTNEDAFGDLDSNQYYNVSPSEEPLTKKRRQTCRVITDRSSFIQSALMDYVHQNSGIDNDDASYASSADSENDITNYDQASFIHQALTNYTDQRMRRRGSDSSCSTTDSFIEEALNNYVLGSPQEESDANSLMIATSMPVERKRKYGTVRSIDIVDDDDDSIASETLCKRQQVKVDDNMLHMDVSTLYTPQQRTVNMVDMF